MSTVTSSIKQFSLDYLSNKCTQIIYTNGMLSKSNEDFLKQVESKYKNDPNDENFLLLNSLIDATIKEGVNLVNINLVRRVYKMTAKYTVSKILHHFKITSINLSALDRYKADLEHSPHAYLSHFHDRLNKVYTDCEPNEHHLWTMTKEMTMHVIADTFDMRNEPDLNLKPHFEHSNNFINAYNNYNETLNCNKIGAAKQDHLKVTTSYHIVRPFTCFSFVSEQP